MNRDRKKEREEHALFMGSGFFLLGRILYFFSTSFDILAKPLHGVAGSESETHGNQTDDGNDFFHDIFPFRLTDNAAM